MKLVKMKSIAVLLVFLFAVMSLAACAGQGNNQEETSNSGSNAGSESSTSTNTATEEADAESDVYPENGLSKSEKVTLKLGFFESGMKREYIDYAMDTFKAKFPNVNFEVTYSPSIDKIVETKISANNDEDMFDLFNAYLGTWPVMAAPYVEAGKVEDLEPLWDHKAFDGNGKTLKELVDNGTYETTMRYYGKTYDFPTIGAAAGLFFDKNLFEQHGWNQNPQTWSEFLALLEDIKGEGIIPITYTGVHNYYIENAFGPWKLFELAEMNGNLAKFEDDYRNYKVPYYTSPERLELWNRIYELGKKGYFPEGVAALDHTQAQMQVLQHKAAMVSTGSWVENEMKDSTPEGFRWGFMVVPMSEDPAATKWSRMSTGNSFFVWAARPDLNKKWAKEFIVWLWNLDVQQIIGEKGGQLPLRLDFADDPDRADKIQSLLKEVLVYYSKNNIRGESAFQNITPMDPLFAQAQKVANDAITAITSGEQDPLPIMQEAEEILKKALEAQQ